MFKKILSHSLYVLMKDSSIVKATAHYEVRSADY